MNFWKVLKYVMMIAFAIIVVGSALMATDDTTTVQQPVPQTSGPKFNL